MHTMICRCRKDHQWTPTDPRNQQIIGLSTGTMNAPGTTWPSAPPTSAPFAGSGNMWQQPSTTNPFAAPNGSSVCSN
jgi:hypothetical protein